VVRWEQFVVNVHIDILTKDGEPIVPSTPMAKSIRAMPDVPLDLIISCACIVVLLGVDLYVMWVRQIQRAQAGVPSSPRSTTAPFATKRYCPKSFAPKT
jgi:hypothetical protein